MRITAYRARDYKAIKDVSVTPGERALLVVAGNNGQGKSSLLDGLTAAFGGRRQTDADPVRHGAEAAELTVELDGGAVTLRRRITAADNRLEVYDASGRRRSPQAVLDQLVGQRFLDPLAFLRLAPAAQRDALLACVAFPDGFSIPRWEAEHARAYEARTDAGRTHRQAAAELAAAGTEPLSPPPAVSTSALAERLTALHTELRARHEAHEAHRARRAASAAEVERLAAACQRQEGVVQRAQEALLQVQRAYTESRALADAEEPAPAPTEEIGAAVAEVQGQLAGAEQANHERAAAAATRSRWEEAQRRAAAALAAHEAADAAVETLAAAKAAAMAAATLPIEDLDVGPAGVLLGGVPFAQASAAEQLRASLAIAMALSPNLRDVWVKDGSLLDADNMALVEQTAEAHGCRVWLERVGEGEDGAIVIRAGEVVP